MSERILASSKYVCPLSIRKSRSGHGTETTFESYFSAMISAAL